MIIETLIGGSAALGAMYFAAKHEPSEAKRIRHIFSNVGYKVGDKLPTYLRTRRELNWIEHIFNVPYGLIDDPKLQPIIEKTLTKPTCIYFDGKLHVRLYRRKLSEHISYDWSRSSGWTVPIGYNHDGLIEHDFDKIPHMTVAGTTRYGKTVLLKLIITHLIRNNSDDISLSIIDLKGGLEFGWYEKLRQVNRVASDVNEASELLKCVLERIKDDMNRFKSIGISNVLDGKITRRHFVIVDEAAELMPPSQASRDEKKTYRYCQNALSEVARVAGALGYRLIFCTQYPTADTLPRQIKQNADAKIAFRLPTEVASRVAIDDSGANELANPGRAIYRTHRKDVVQVPYLSDAKIKEYLRRYIDDSNGKMESKSGSDIIEFG